MTTRLTNNSFPMENTSSYPRRDQPAQSNNRKEVSLLQTTIIKSSRSLIKITEREFRLAVNHKIQLEIPLKKAIKQRFLEKITNYPQYTPQKKHLLESLASIKADQIAKKEIYAHRKKLPEAARIALKTNDILEEIQTTRFGRLSTS